MPVDREGGGSGSSQVVRRRRMRVGGYASRGRTTTGDARPSVPIRGAPTPFAAVTAMVSCAVESTPSPQPVWAKMSSTVSCGLSQCGK